VDDDNEPEAHGAVQPGENGSHQTYVPADINMLGPQRSNRNPMPFKPRSHLFVDSLKAGGISGNGLSNPAEATDDERAQNGDAEDEHRNGHHQDDDAWHQRLQPLIPPTWTAPFYSLRDRHFGRAYIGIHGARGFRPRCRPPILRAE